MKLPWNRNYLKISFHIIFTLVVLGIILMVLANIKEVSFVIGVFINSFLSLTASLFIGLIMAFLLDPIVCFFQKTINLPKKDKNNFETRTKETILTYITIGLAIIIFVVLAIRNIGASHINQVSNTLNGYIDGFMKTLFLLQNKISNLGILKGLNGAINNFINSFINEINYILFMIGNKIPSLGKLIFDIFLGVFISFYILKEKEKTLHTVNYIGESIFSPKAYANILEFFRNVNKIFSGFISGQIIDAFIMTFLISITFWIIGIPYAFFIGIISGFSNLVPYVGAIVAFVLGVLMGLISDEPIKALYGAIAIIILQQIDSVIIVPKILGERVKLPPVLVILALTFFGGLWGVVGMVIAVPVTAIIKIYFYKYIETIRKKRFEKN